MEQIEYIDIYGARENNLKNVNVRIPLNQLTVVTGLSGSGKSSLAFNTLYAEGQRRYMETFSAYARNFMGGGSRPDVDEITGLSPVIAIEQKTTNNNPRSTVGTVTEIYDYLRLLYARASDAYSYISGERMVKYSEEQILQLVLEAYNGERIYLLAPAVRSRKGHYRELFEQWRRKGYLHARVDGQLCEITAEMRLDRYKNHDIELVIDRLQVGPDSQERLKRSLSTAIDQGDGVCAILRLSDNQLRYFSRQLMCPTSGIAYNDPAPHDFSFNSPQGCCKRCHGTGVVNTADRAKLIPDPHLSIAQGAIAPLGKLKSTAIFAQIRLLCKRYNTTLDTPVEQLPEALIEEIIEGCDEPLLMQDKAGSGNYQIMFRGIADYINSLQDDEASKEEKRWAAGFSQTVVCPECGGTRLKKEALCFKLSNKNIAQLGNMDLNELYQWFCNEEPQWSERQRQVSAEICKEIKTRLQFLLNVGLHYLSLNRATASLSGGESQRIRLATQIGSQLVNVLYILDEPSIGLHPRDNVRLIESLKQLRDAGNTVVVVEHDKDMMLSSDYIIDLGPRAGRLGGNLVFQGSPSKLLETDTLTASYLKGSTRIEHPTTRRTGNGHILHLEGASGHNLKNISVDFPLGRFICITGVSGSGKSSLINSTLLPILSKHFYRSLREPLPYTAVSGLEYIDKVVAVDQSPIGRTPRSNPATYTGLLDDIRNIFASLPEARIRGYKAGRFSFNVKEGRCEHCQGNGFRKIEMGFLPDVYVPCESCQGKRYNRETLEVRYKGKSMGDVLDMTINQATEFFESIPSLLQKLHILQEVGLGYIKLGQPSTTLSGGENQRVKLATELAKRDTGKTLYLLDEPTTGLHFEDIRILLQVLDTLVNRGNSLIVIEHNIDMILHADYLIDMGPEGGRQGGEVICCGTPEQVAAAGIGNTAPFIKEALQNE